MVAGTLAVDRCILLPQAGLALAGGAIGVAGALLVTREMRSLLFGVDTIDPLTFVGAALLMAIVTAAACYIPARRAMHVDPMVTLRHE
jgi:putative ABC transport system permease protein